MSGLFRNEGWQFGGGLSSSYFRVLFEYALTFQESERRVVMSRKFSWGEAGGWVLPLADDRATCATSCHHRGSPPLVAKTSHGWIDWRYFLQWGNSWAEATVAHYKYYRLYSPWSPLYQLCLYWQEHKSNGIAQNPPKHTSPNSQTPSLCYACDLWCPQLADTHLCAEVGEKSPFPEACLCAVASWTHGDQCREHVISCLIKCGLQSQGSFINCHTDLSFKAQRRKQKKEPNLLFKTRNKNWLK